MFCILLSINYFQNIIYVLWARYNFANINWLIKLNYVIEFTYTIGINSL